MNARFDVSEDELRILQDYACNIEAQMKALMFEHKVKSFLIVAMLQQQRYNVERTAEKHKL